MKFLKTEPFEKHLYDSLPDHVSPFYLILIQDSFEREFLAKHILKFFTLPYDYLNVDDLMKEIQSPLLFSKKRILVCNNIEAFKEKSLPLPSDLILILLGKSKPTFFESVKKEGITLDLIQEKQWERKNRLQRWLLLVAKDHGKKLSNDVLAYLFEYGSENFAILLQELQKVIIYAGEEKEVTLEMLKKITTLVPNQDGWNLSEALVWGGTVSRRSIQSEDIYGLIGKIRYQLQLGVTLASGGQLEKIPFKRLEKLKPLATAFTLSYFTDALKELLNLEIKMRSGISDQTLLIDTFNAKLTQRRYALSYS